MTPQELRERTKTFAIKVVRLCKKLPVDWEARELGKQLLRSGTSVAANYRAAQRARSDREFCSKIGLVVEEADESQLWLEILPEAAPTIDGSQKELLKEAGELTAIFTASHHTARQRLDKKKDEKKKRRAPK